MFDRGDRTWVAKTPALVMVVDERRQIGSTRDRTRWGET
jgi:hypothetical protein